MTMAKDGYIFKHKDISDMFGIDYSWYMRIVRSIKTQLAPYNDEKPYKIQENTPKKEKITKNTPKIQATSQKIAKQV